VLAYAAAVSCALVLQQSVEQAEVGRGKGEARLMFLRSRLAGFGTDVRFGSFVAI